MQSNSKMFQKMKAGKGEITRELQQLGAKKLASHNKSSGFGVPEGYFEGFSLAVQKKVEAQIQEQNTSNTRFIKLKTAVSIAASIVLVASLAITLLLLQPDREEVVNNEFYDIQFEEFFANVTLNDRTLLYDLILDQESEPFEENFSGTANDDYLFEYLVDASRYQGIDLSELFTQNGIDNQR